MSKTLFIANLPFSLNEEGLRNLFETAGPVVSVRIALDRETRRPRGFGFVEFESSDDAEVALREFSGRRVGNRELVVNEAQVQKLSGGARR